MFKYAEGEHNQNMATIKQNVINNYFFQLPIELKVKIFGMLNISSRYNAGMVWKEIMEERVSQILLNVVAPH